MHKSLRGHPSHSLGVVPSGIGHKAIKNRREKRLKSLKNTVYIQVIYRLDAGHYDFRFHLITTAAGGGGAGAWGMGVTP